MVDGKYRRYASCRAACCVETSRLQAGYCSKHFQRVKKWGVPDLPHRPCSQCGESFQPKQERSTTCSKRCLWQARNRKAGARPKEVYLAGVVSQANWFTCEQCLTASHRKISGGNRKAGYAQRFCSQACRIAWHADRRSPAKEPSPCVICKTLCARVGARYCSESCRVRWALIDYFGCKTPVRCAVCDAEYCRVPGAWNHGLCSDECSEAHYAALGRAANLRRRARIYAGERDRIDPIRVLERDKWRCHICGVKTPKALRGTMDDRAPEMDHIVAIADGGTHTWGNVACACKRCNRIKGASSKGQLGLAFAA